MSTSTLAGTVTELVAVATLPAIDATLQLGIKSVSDPLHLSNPDKAL